MANTNASNVSRLIDRPANHMTAQVANRQIGTVMAGMMVARTEPKNRKMTRMTSSAASISVS